MDSKPVTIRLLDAPLHEFLEDSHEQNPMLGLRGVRLALVTENLYRAQTRALISAAQKRLEASGNPVIEIMVPLVSIDSVMSCYFKRPPIVVRSCIAGSPPVKMTRLQL